MNHTRIAIALAAATVAQQELATAAKVAALAGNLPLAQELEAKRAKILDAAATLQAALKA